MSDDDRRRERNGRDPIVVPLPLERPRREPVQAPARTWRTEYEWQRSMTNTVVQLVPAVNDQTEAVAEVHAQTLVLTRAVNRLAERLPADPDQSYHEFDPAVAELRREMKRRIKAGDDPLTEEGAVEFMQRVLAQMKSREEDQSDARKWRRVRSIPHLIVEHWIVAAVCAGLGTGTGVLVHWVLSLLHH